MTDGHQAVFEELESQVRYYCRRVPNLFRSARGAIVRDAAGVEFIDFLSACGSLNYGHNHPHLVAAAIHHLTTGGILAGLDFHTEAKLDFLSKFAGSILVPRGMSYRMQFPGPTGANCVEAAIKLARKVTGRNNVVAFTNAFHGVSLGALALTGSRSSRDASSSLLNGVIRIAYEGYCGAGIDDLRRLEAMATDPSGGVDPIAAFIVETVQGEGGLNVASTEWLRALASAAKRIGALLIVDDIQAGCGRAGGFFSFERADLDPDMVCLAKSISGAGFPMSLLLLKPELDVWEPGEHNGTFRGNTLAFATAAAALDLWDDDFQRGIAIRAKILERWCDEMETLLPSMVTARGIGMMRGLLFCEPETAHAVAEKAASRGLLIECCGPRDEVLKILAPLTIDLEIFNDGLARLADCIQEAAAESALRGIPVLEVNEAPLDPYDYCRDAVIGA